MKFRTLIPWLKGNESITPENFYGKLKPCFEKGAFIGLDCVVDLHLANTIDTGDLQTSWHKTKWYIEEACNVVDIDVFDAHYLNREEKEIILENLGEPPECCYNLYFITVYNERTERLVYVGKTDSKKSRFANGHLAALKLHSPEYKEYNKRIYFGTATFLSEDGMYIPLEFITPYEEASRLLGEMEALLIGHFSPELNVRHEQQREKNLLVHIQNFSNLRTFLNDYIIFPKD